MSCDYKFKMKATLKNGRAKTSLVESYTFSRADIKDHLAKLNLKPELDNGERLFKKIMEEALTEPRWKKLTITRRK